jgi:hypothetical protein
MTNDEVKDFLLKVSTERFAAWQRGKIVSEFPQLPPNPDICAQLWYVGVVPSRDALVAAGATSEQIDAAMSALKAELAIIEPLDLVPIPTELALEIEADLKKALAEEPDSQRQRLDERLVNWITEYRVEIYSNEGQHRGRPHVSVFLPGGRVSVSLDDPPILLTPNGYRGEASAVKVVQKYRVKLLALWNDTRPDDQRLPFRGSVDIAKSNRRNPKRAR